MGNQRPDKKRSDQGDSIGSALSFQGQLKIIWSMVFSPRQTILSLPQDQFCWVAFVVAFLAGQGRSLYITTELLGSREEAFVFVLIGSLVIYPFAVALLVLVMRVFGKRLAYAKVFNLLGYIHSPRLLFSFAVLTIAALNGMSPLGFYESLKSSVYIGPLIICGVIALFYSLFLLVWGLSICPGRTSGE